MPPDDPTAESLFAAWLARHESGEECDFDVLLKDHDSHAAELRDLHAQWQRLERIRRQQGIGGSLAERIKTQYGSGVDPKITLSPGSEAPKKSDFSSEILARLAGRGPASTRYRLEGEIAHGGMGAVLGVWDGDLRRHLAMKVMLGKGTTAGTGETPPVDPRMLSRFLEEAQVTGQLDHPGIVPVHELGLDPEGRVFFTMKLVKGRTLKDVFDELAVGEGGWTQTRVLGLLLKVCEAMSYAHAKNVIHRDLKPANVMVGRFGEVYVMDWGLAKVMGREDERDIRVRPQGVPTTSDVHSERKDRAGETPESPLYTMDGDVVGTPAYMAPEQAKGDLDAMGPHSDVYAIGAMLYHLIAGHMPYVPHGARASNYIVLRWVHEGPPKPLYDVAPNTPAELVAICEKAMAREVEDRYPDTAVLAEDLSAYVEGRVVHAYETGALAEAKKWVRRNKPLAASLAAAAMILMLGVGSVAYVQAEGKRAAQEQERIAIDQRRIANERAEDVLRLSALQDLEDLIGEADALWPPYPQNIEPYRDWISKAEALVADLPQQYAKQNQLRALALPRSAEQRQEERENHPEYGRFRALTGEIQSRRRALVQRRDGVAVQVPEVDWSLYPDDVLELNDVAWALVDPERTEFGEEPLGLALALRALEIAGEDPKMQASIEKTLAWAYSSVGRDRDAYTTMQRTLERAKGIGWRLKSGLRDLEELAADATSEESLEKESDELDRLEKQLSALDGRVNERRDWRFPDEHGEARWWNAQLTKLIDGLESLHKGLLVEDAATPEHGWSVPKRLAFASELQAGFAPDGQYAAIWERDLPAIRKAYPRIDIKPQLGLLPIGADPHSGLWEFAHLMTGLPVERCENGHLIMTEESSIVLVLLPGGDFWMGAQPDFSRGRNYDAQAETDEGPVHEVHLSSFFLSKYEVTQGQWTRLTGGNPSYYRPDEVAGAEGSNAPVIGSGAGPWRSQGLRLSALPTLMHPVDVVSWLDCMEWLPRVGLSLPSEAQWEYGARGGSDTPWWTGLERESLQERHAANLADQAAAWGFASWPAVGEWPELDDGYVVHAPVGTYAANGFGLHEIHGNVWEICLDGYDRWYYGRSPKVDPVAPWESAANRVYRGGGFTDAAVRARSAKRSFGTPTNVGPIGVRPARTIEP